MLRASDLLLLTTEPPESFGIVLIEAMACGLPAIATDYPGVRAVIDQDRNGLLVPLGNAEAVAAALRHLVDSGPGGAARSAPRGAAPLPSGAGRSSSSAWTPPTTRRGRGGARERR